ncbi:MBL fold metallo-hydrolase [Paractinoplanes toevensis]|uniref:MBL fold metallo-hydrolase n=1 Tax=Paractinoplanes toevensis TaxID=571911 RepID=A0A919TDD2_9ACTN|nr:MBL fold metallo-hydrolase [Actinoplanes toevensis]GIM93027.1 MBL fold metallo-hydrolase [Actinoplanes toevensis]
MGIEELLPRDVADLPDYAPIPESELGPALNANGYHVGQVHGNLYYVTEGVYQAPFLVTPEGVVLIDAPPTIGHNIQRGIDDVARQLGLPNKVTHFIYSHNHTDHAGATALFGDDLVRIGHRETRNLLLRANDPNRPAPHEVFDSELSLTVGGERLELAWHGTNHSPDNIFINLPEHDTLVVIDVVLPGWAPFANFNLHEDVQGAMAAAKKINEYHYSHLIAGHLGRIATPVDVRIQQQYNADLEESVKTALSTTDPTPFFVRYSANPWAGSRHYLEAVAAAAARPIVEKYTGVLAGVDVFALTSAFQMMQSNRLDIGFGSYIHP